MNNTDTITIPRDLFERLCEMASDCEAQSRWMNGKGSRAQKYYDECLCTKNEAVASKSPATTAFFLSLFQGDER